MHVALLSEKPLGDLNLFQYYNKICLKRQLKKAFGNLSFKNKISAQLNNRNPFNMLCAVVILILC